MRNELCFLSKNLSDAFYSFDTKDLEWHKFSIAYHAFLFVNANEKDNYLLNLYKEKFGAAFFIIYEAIKNGDVLTKISELKRHCPTCGRSINKKLDPREYHLVCPHCKTHFIINGDVSGILNSVRLMSIKRKDNEIYNIQLVDDNRMMRAEIEGLKNRIENERKAQKKS